jgi:hypothetical protein
VELKVTAETITRIREVVVDSLAQVLKAIMRLLGVILPAFNGVPGPEDLIVHVQHMDSHHRVPRLHRFQKSRCPWVLIRVTTLLGLVAKIAR